MMIVGITGTLGAGKGTIVDYLMQEKGFVHLSARAFIREEAERRGLPVNRDSLVVVANDLRAKHSPSYIIDQLYLKAAELNRNCVIESIRTPGEVDSLREKPAFKLFAVDANPELRYERIKIRNSETDHVDYATFLANEEREMTTADPNKQNLRQCIEMADFVFENNASIADLHSRIEDVLTQMNLGI